MPTPKRKAGRKKFKETRHPVYRGVRERNGGKWVCEVREPNKKTRIWLGTYPTPEMAARAHDVAAIALRGKSAALNFEDSSWLLPRAGSNSSVEIRRVASEAAERFRPAVSSPRQSMPSPSLSLQPPAAFVDEEALFNMPGLLKEMAEGLMLTPPEMQEAGGFDWDGSAGDAAPDGSHMSLWTN